MSEIKVFAGPFSLWTCREKILPCLFLASSVLLALFGVFWLAEASFQSSVFTLPFCLWLCLSCLTFHFYKDFSHVGEGDGTPTPVLLPGKSHGRRSLVGCSPRGPWESDATEWLHFHFNALEKEMATHSTVLAWRIPGTGELGGLQSMGSQRVRHNWATSLSLPLYILVGFISKYWRTLNTSRVAPQSP